MAYKKKMVSFTIYLISYVLNVAKVTWQSLVNNRKAVSGSFYATLYISLLSIDYFNAKNEKRWKL